MQDDFNFLIKKDYQEIYFIFLNPTWFIKKSNEYVQLETNLASVPTKYAQNEIDDLLSQLNLADVCPSATQPTQSEQNIFYKDLK